MHMHMWDACEKTPAQKKWGAVTPLVPLFLMLMHYNATLCNEMLNFFLWCIHLTTCKCDILLVHVAGAQFTALVVPSCPGALFDLASSPYMAEILKSFIKEKSGCSCLIY